MKKDLYHFFNILFLVVLFFGGFTLTEAAETPFIPPSIKKTIPTIGLASNFSNSIENQGVEDSTLSSLRTYNETFDPQGGLISYYHYGKQRDGLISKMVVAKYGLSQERRGYETPSIYIRTVARYLSVSGDAATGSLSGGFAAGFYVGLDRFLDAGIIDLGAVSRATVIMSGSSYFGLMAGKYATDMVISPIFSSFGSGFVNAAGSAAGGTIAGVLYAFGAYASGSVDRHTAKLMVAKSAVGATAAASITAITGVSTVTTGIFALGTFAFPYLTAIAASYIVEKFFEATDKQEEKERIDRLVEKSY